MNNPSGRKIILASASPRRKILLGKCGADCFETDIPRAPEIKPDPGRGNLSSLALDNAVRKAEEVARRHPESLIVAADTVIELDHEILGKPADRGEALRFLLRLAGRTHRVVTGVCLRCLEPEIMVRFAETSEVDFKPFDRSTAEEYMRLVNVLDKAGAYAVQEHPELIISAVRGSLDNVAGLPVERLSGALECALAVPPRKGRADAGTCKSGKNEYIICLQPISLERKQ